MQQCLSPIALAQSGSFAFLRSTPLSYPNLEALALSSNFLSLLLSVTTTVNARLLLLLLLRRLFLPHSIALLTCHIRPDIISAGLQNIRRPQQGRLPSAVAVVPSKLRRWAAAPTILLSCDNATAKKSRCSRAQKKK